MKTRKKLLEFWRCIAIMMTGSMATLAIQAQTVEDFPQTADSVLPHDTLTVSLVSPLPQTGYTPFTMVGITPFDYGYGTWNLHEGFNASVGMNLTFSTSKYAPSGVGFGQDAAFLYAVPVNKRVSLAGGMYASHLNWGGYNYRSIGFVGIAGYKVNEHISLYAYGNKSIMPQRAPYYYPIPNFAPDRLGGMLHIKFNDKAAVSFSVEARKYRGGYYPYW